MRTASLLRYVLPLAALAVVLLSVVSLGLRSAEGGRAGGPPGPGSEAGTYGRVSRTGSVQVAGLSGSPPPPSGDHRPSAPRRRVPEAQPTAAATPGSNGGVQLSDGAGGPSAPVQAAVASSFAGLGSTDNPSTLRPPDPQLAAGPDSLIEMVNDRGRIFSKTGTPVGTPFALAGLFLVPTGYFNFDPKVIFDAASGRFFASFTSLLDNRSGNDFAFLHVAVSNTSDPAGTWTTYAFPMTNDFPDYSGIGVADDKVVVSYNRFDIDASGYAGVQTLVLQKSQMLAGAGVVSYFLSTPNPNIFAVRPAHSLTSTTSEYMVSVSENPATHVNLWRVTGTPSGNNVSIVNVFQPVINSHASPAPADAMGSAGGIDAGDNRMQEAVWQNGKLWASASSYCIFQPEQIPRSCLKLIQIDTGSGATLQDMLFGAATLEYYYPSLRVDSAGNLAVVFSRSSASSFIEARVVTRLASDPVNTLASSVQLKAGEIAYTPAPSAGEPPYRWGDYMGSALDPADGTSIWVVGEYAKNDTNVKWGTYIGRVQVAPVGPSATPTATRTNTPVPTNTNTPTATPTQTRTNTPVPTNTNTPTAASTATSTQTRTSTSTPANTNTPTPTRTNTPTPTNTNTPVPTNTSTPTATSTSTSTNTSTPIPTSTPTVTPTPTSTPAAATCTGDVSLDRTVNSLDLLLVSQHFVLTPGSPAYNAAYDVNHDGVINSLDLLLVAQHYGPCPAT